MSELSADLITDLQDTRARAMNDGYHVYIDKLRQAWGDAAEVKH